MTLAYSFGFNLRALADLEMVKVESGTAQKIDFAVRAATHVLRADSDRASVFGTSLQQRVTTMDQDESSWKLLASVPAGFGPW